jgi:thiazole synthase
MKDGTADTLFIGRHEFRSRLFLGTGKFGSLEQMRQALIASGTELVTVALKRVQIADQEDDLLSHLKVDGVRLMPNTSGARTAREAVLVSRLAREALRTDLIKLEIHPDPKYLLPDPIETLRAAEDLVRDGFTVLPYVNADPVLCKRLEEVGVAAVMPLGAPIGTNNGLQTRAMLEIIIEQSRVPVIVDAGIGAPSHAVDALELGADGVLVNTAIATAANPVDMARAFKGSVEAGRVGFLAGLPSREGGSRPSSPLTSFLAHGE